VSRILAALVSLILAVGLAGCSDDEKPASSKEEPAASDSPNPDAILPAAVADAVTPSHLDPVCADGRFTEVDDVLGTLPAEYAEDAEQIYTYDCDDQIDQVVWVELPDADRAEELLDQAAAGGASAFVASTTALLVAPRLLTEVGLDVTAYFEALAEACGCGSYVELTDGP